MTPTIPQRPRNESHFVPVDAHEWQLVLIGFLARLEAIRIDLESRRLNTDVALIIEAAESLVLSADDLQRQTVFADESHSAQGDAIGKAGEFYATVGTLRRNVLKGQYRTSVAARTMALRECLTAAIDALHTYFILFTEHYPSSQAARGWVDAASTFLVELKTTVKNLKD